MSIFVTVPSTRKDGVTVGMMQIVRQSAMEPKGVEIREWNFARDRNEDFGFAANNGITTD